ncbi:hypothetical protein ERX46_03445 [Brumimicrobium glaciale]|jgi:hypothetical protein|uniref:Uncharacterized protein n=1 Tax=Brumimicrobium glaciale TaxID=200475 RepID=A0A4Q4KRW2_9FLAO|nr:hypothetical protein [Brumimicrobium glaciale]RYM36063.1 hypothetical protein ERX46_03445 [Brumimicrobium glaciale]
MNSLKYNLYYLESQFVGFPLVIRVTIFLVTILALIYIGSLIRIFFLARTQTRMTNREKEIQKKYEKKLKTILFSDEDISTDEIKRRLGLDSDSLNEWEKFHVTKLMINLIKQNEKVEVSAK